MAKEVIKTEILTPPGLIKIQEKILLKPELAVEDYIVASCLAEIAQAIENGKIEVRTVEIKFE